MFADKIEEPSVEVPAPVQEPSKVEEPPAESTEIQA